MLWPGCRYRRCRITLTPQLPTEWVSMLSRSMPQAHVRCQDTSIHYLPTLSGALKIVPPPAAVVPQAMPQRRPHGTPSHSSIGEPGEPCCGSSAAEGQHRCSPTIPKYSQILLRRSPVGIFSWPGLPYNLQVSPPLAQTQPCERVLPEVTVPTGT